MPDMFDRMAEAKERGEKDAAFQAFWTHWPDKRNKDTARKAFAKLKPEDRQKATDRAASWCKKWRAENPQASHIHAATYLNQKRFLDEDEKQTANVEDWERVIAFKAKWIVEGKSFLAQHIPRDQVETMLQSGLVTPEQVRGVGL